MRPLSKIFAGLVLTVVLCCCSTGFVQPALIEVEASGFKERPKLADIDTPVRQVLESANEQIKTTRAYTQQYYVIAYPGGDVPEETGACTDVIVRSFRKAGIDLQKEVHEDMAANFSVYPQKWALERPDTNIDHRRVPNLQTFL